MYSNMLFQNEFKITDQIKIRIPTLAEILKNEREYYDLVYMLTAMPIDMMVQLDDWGIDFSQITSFELFVLLLNSIKTMDTSLVFGDLDLSKFELAERTDTGAVVLVDQENEIIIDELTQFEIAECLRAIHGIKRDDRKPGNEEARKFLIKRARSKMRREKDKRKHSQLEPLIIAMVNAEQFKYNFDTIKDLSIYQFNKCVEHIINKVNFDNRMYGVYAGTVDAKELSKDELSWIKMNYS